MENMKEKVEKVLLDVKEQMKSYLDCKTLITDGILDSLDIMNLVMALEEEFEIEIDPEDVMSDNFESVDAIEKLIEKCRG